MVKRQHKWFIVSAFIRLEINQNFVFPQRLLQAYSPNVLVSPTYSLIDLDGSGVKKTIEEFYSEPQTYRALTMQKT